MDQNPSIAPAGVTTSPMPPNSLSPSELVNRSLVYGMERAASVLVTELHKELKQALPPSMSIEEWRVLYHLMDTPDDTVSNIAEACLWQQPSMSKLLDRMESRFLVQRFEDPRDRRRVRVRPLLSSELEQRLSAARLIMRAHEAGIAKDLEFSPTVLRPLFAAMIARQRRSKRQASA